jgi:hypothetical protein
MKLSDLSNSEVLFLYFNNQLIVDKYQKIFETKNYKTVVEIFDLGEIIINHNVSEEDISEMETSEYYIQALHISEKLHLVVELIEDTDPKLVHSIRNLVHNVKED